MPPKSKQAKNTEAKAPRKPSKAKVNGDGTRRIIKKGVQRPLRNKPMDVLIERAGEYQRRLDKHVSACERIRGIQNKYQMEIDWKNREAGETVADEAQAQASEVACEEGGA